MRKAVTRSVLMLALAASPALAQQAPQPQPENSQVKLAGLLAQNLAVALGQVDALQSQVAALTAQVAELKKPPQPVDPNAHPAKP